MTEKEVRKLLKENGRTWREFVKWMSGQTLGLNEDGTTDFYDWDVERFIQRKQVID